MIASTITVIAQPYLVYTGISKNDTGMLCVRKKLSIFSKMDLD